MTRTRFPFFAALVIASAGAAPLFAQDAPIAYKPAKGMTVGEVAGWGMAMPALRAETGQPLSATVTSQTTQNLADGTHINRTMTRVEYRDVEGRTRTESETGTGNEKKLSILIRDPVARVTYMLDPAMKTATKMSMPGAAPVAKAMGRGRGMPAPAVARAGNVLLPAIRPSEPQAAAVPRSDPNETTDDLGTTMVNGVLAHGTRVTTIVPAGAIGNDREFRSVSERWISDDLSMVVKSSSSDPRFGTTTYEVTNISRASPDPALFQVPADYKIQ